MKALHNEKRLVSFDDCDPAGILFFANHMKWAHQLIENFWAQSDLGWKFWFQNPEWGAPLRHVETDYKAPVFAGETVQVRLFLAQRGDSSVKFCTLIEDTEGKVLAEVQTTHVCVSKATRQSRDFPAAVWQALDASTH